VGVKLQCESISSTTYSSAGIGQSNGSPILQGKEEMIEDELAT
jgi:hypothetical protein